VRFRTGIEGAVLSAILAGSLALATVNRASLQFRNANVIPFFVGAQTKGELVREYLGTYAEAAEYLGGKKAGGAILADGEIKSYRMPRPFLVGTTINIADAPLIWKLANASLNTAEFRKKLRQLDVRRILHNPMRSLNSAYLFTPFVWSDRMYSLTLEFFKSWTEPEYLPKHAEQRNGVFYVYRVLDSPRRHGSRNLFTLPGCEGLFIAGMTRLKEDQPARAVELLEPMQKRFPTVYQVTDILAYAMLRARRSNGACDLYRPGVAAGMVDDVNIYDFACAAYVTKRYEEAVKWFDRAAEVYPDLREASVTGLHEARIAAIRAAAGEGRLARVESLARAGLLDGRIAGIRDRRRARQWRGEYGVALAVVDALRGRRPLAVRELAELTGDVPWLKGMPLDDVIKLVKRKK
jgi:tetratricopeptide (TPR) repeat protein